MKAKYIIDKAISTYGESNQILKAVEELGELKNALIDYNKNSSEENLKNVITEIADVKIISKQLLKIFGYSLIKEEMDKNIKSISTLDYSNFSLDYLLLLGNLQVSLLHFKRKKFTKFDIIPDIAKGIILTNKLQYIYGSQEIKKEIEIKLARLYKRLKENKKKEENVCLFDLN